MLVGVFECLRLSGAPSPAPLQPSDSGLVSTAMVTLISAVVALIVGAAVMCIHTLQAFQEAVDLHHGQGIAFAVAQERACNLLCLFGTGPDHALPFRHCR